MSSLELTLKTAHPRARATLVRLLRDFDKADEAVQEAAARAMLHWPEQGVPDHPVAWLVRTGRNYIFDMIRRKNVAARHAETIAILSDHDDFPSDDSRLSASIEDDLLRLIFTYCHPILAQEGQIALTLKAVAGLTVEAIGRAFLVSASAMEKRLTRAKAKRV